MQIAIIGTESQKLEWMAHGQDECVSVQWLSEPVLEGKPDALIDLSFVPDKQRIDYLKKTGSSLVIINVVSFSQTELPSSFVRLNGWPFFLKRKLAEVSCTDETLKPLTEKIFTAFNRKTSWVPDQAGFISARVISMIINEAFFALEEGVSSRQEIDTAMKLGTNYPFGPFEWGELIGMKNVFELLNLLQVSDPRYMPADLLRKEAAK